ncbi:pectin acetylesterase 8-like isoform X2 [Sesamum indicum]|uniref:Pectin acetylesterase n=1 Tax=Sesamum indicum TaxID=4182 RepID=A0A8M8V318_SESIN|nr:pectin acetylesterase 8-like isoform X2 [Sesamum indicum]
MEKSIRSTGDYWTKLLICALILLTTQVHCHFNPRINVTFLDNAVSTGAVCLDGSPAGYHYEKGYGTGADNWLVYLPGGAWCGSKGDCLARTKTIGGTTVNVTTTWFGGILSADSLVNPDLYNWHRTFIRYCDGASFMADVEAVDPETNLHLRGARIFRAVVDVLLAKGMKNAKNIILAGNSAGGLATILNCDRFRALVPNASRVKCLSDSGFFIRAQNLPGVEKREKGFADVVAFHCMFPEYLVGDVQTPLFLLHSAFDQYQIQYNLKPYPAIEQGWKECTSNTRLCTPAQIDFMKEFRTTFLQTLKAIPDCPSRGMFINSCYIHDFLFSRARWNYQGPPSLGNKIIERVIGDWYFERCSAKAIDAETDHPLNCFDA